MVWREPKDHSIDCYFLFGEHKRCWQRAEKTSLIPVFHHLFDLSRTLIDSHLQSLMVLYLLMKQVKVFMECEYKEPDTKSEDSSSEMKLAYHQFNQSELNDLLRDLDLSKQAAELLASRLNEKHLLDSSAKVSFFRKRDELFLSFFRGKAAGLLQ